MTPKDVGGHPVLRVVYFDGSPIETGVNLVVLMWSEKHQERVRLSTWVTPELAEDTFALRAYLLMALQDAEEEHTP